MCCSRGNPTIKFIRNQIDNVALYGVAGGKRRFVYGYPRVDFRLHDMCRRHCRCVCFIGFCAVRRARSPSVTAQNSAVTARHAAAVLSTPAVNLSQTAPATKRVAPSLAASNRPIPGTPPDAEKRKPSRQVSVAQLRRLARQERNKHLAYQQDPDFDARFLGYAD